MQDSDFSAGRRAALAGISAVGLGAVMVACGGGSGSSGTGTPPPSPPPEPPPGPGPVVNGPAWPSFGRDAQHSAVSAIATQPLSKIVWQTPVDMAPQYSPQGYLMVRPAIAKAPRAVRGADRY